MACDFSKMINTKPTIQHEVKRLAINQDQKFFQPMLRKQEVLWKKYCMQA